MEEKSTHPRQSWWKNLLFFLMLVFVGGLTSLISLTGNAVYPSLYGYEAAKEGVYDLSRNMNVHGNHAWIRISGEFEFFYDQWLITDQLENPSLTAYAQAGKSWTSLKGGGRRILALIGLWVLSSYLAQFPFGEQIHDAFCPRRRGLQDLR
jgi:hypothetical protein